MSLPAQTNFPKARRANSNMAASILFIVFAAAVISVSANSLGAIYFFTFTICLLK